MKENPGFIVQISKEAAGEKIINSLNIGIPAELGSEIYYKSNSTINWAFLGSKDQNELNTSFVHENNETLIIFIGSLYNGNNSETNKLLIIEELKKIISDNWNKELLENLLNTLSGYYCGFAWNVKKRTGISFTDRVGMQKLFYARKGGSDFFTSNLLLMTNVLNNEIKTSDFALSSILFCGHTFNKQSIFKDIYQLLPGHYISFSDGNFNLIDYRKYPKREKLSLEESVELVKNSHLNFWKRIKNFVNDDITLLFSRGKDSRIALKYMIDSGINPSLLSYYRDNESYYPFVTFLLKSIADCNIAEKISIYNNFNFEKIKIDNNYLITHLNDIIAINQGTPLHWENYAASEFLSDKSKFICSGYAGDPFAGKSMHNYIFFNKNLSANTHGRFKFKSAGDTSSYQLIKGIISDSHSLCLVDIKELEDAWVRQFESVNSDDLYIINAEGNTRTRHIGRTGPTFHQVRAFAVPVYPFIDSEIMDSYLKIPTKHLLWQKAHLMQISKDKRFNNFPTTRFPLSAKLENRLLVPLGIFKKMEYLKKSFNKTKIEKSNYEDILLAIEKTLKDMRILPDETVDKLLNNCESYSNLYILYNLISALRIYNFVNKLPFKRKTNLIFRSFNGS